MIVVFSKMEGEYKEMYFGYDVCPKCMNTLIERAQSMENANDFEEYSGKYCLVCGRKLVLACVGDKRIDNTLYKIILSEISVSDKKDYVEILKKLDIDISLEELNNRETVIFEGTAVDIYIKMEILDSARMKYTVTPKFPFARMIYNQVCLCSKCGGETVQKIESHKEYINKGFYCENCKDWMLYHSFSRLQLDDTNYQLVFSLKEINCKPECGAKNELLYDLNNLTEKVKRENKIYISGKADKIYSILQMLIAMDVTYEITPPFIHKIGKYREFDDKLIEEILESNRKYN